MKLIIGLGNPGKNYEKTRHNFGFIIIDSLIKKYKLNYKKKYLNSFFWEKIINNEKVIFLKPQTFMNLSGISVFEFINFYKININDILIIYDDKNIPFGKFKLKLSGNSNGHNGIANIIFKLNSLNIKRIKLGIGIIENGIINNNIKYNNKNFVLDKFTKNEFYIINNNILNLIFNLFDDYLINKFTFEKIMSLYNKK